MFYIFHSTDLCEDLQDLLGTEWQSHFLEFDNVVSLYCLLKQGIGKKVSKEN